MARLRSEAAYARQLKGSRSYGEDLSRLVRRRGKPGFSVAATVPIRVLVSLEVRI
jgi:hypothetical protein